MFKCAKPGVLAVSAALALGSLFLSPSGASATEFANILGVGKEDARKASIKALDALSAVFAAIKIIEEGGPGTSKDGLIKAALQLQDAGKLMSEVKFDEKSDAVIVFDNLNEGDRYLLGNALPRLATNLKGSPESLKILYVSFSEATLNMSNLIVKAAGSEGPVFPAIAGEFALYIELGGAVSRTYTTFFKE